MSVSKQLRGPCMQDTIETEGVVYCTDCQEPLCDKCKQDHGRIKVLKHHRLCDLTDLPPQEIKELLKSLIACPNHEHEEVVYLCKDHDVTCCSKCAMADHRKCEEVKLLSDILHDIKVDCSGLKTVLREIQQNCESLLEHERKHEEMIAESERKAMLLLQDVKQKLLDTYNKIEETVVSSIADTKKKIFEQISTQREGVSNTLNDTEHQSSCIEQVEKFGTDIHAVLVQRKIKKEPQTRLQKSVVDLGRSRTRSSFKCTTNTCLDTLLIEIRNSLQIDDTVCDVSEKGSDLDIRQASTNKERILHLQSEVVLGENQLINSNNYPYSCIWIDHHIVIALDNMPSLVIFHEDNETVLSKFTCQTIPWSVSKTGPTDMVITFPRQRKISFAQLRHGNVHLVAEMTTSVPYKDVAMDTQSNQYICLSNTEGQIDVLNIDGTLLHSLSVDSEIKTCIKSSHYLALHVDSRILLLTNKISNEITALNLRSGKKLFYYEHNQPLACAVDPTGDLYVACVPGNIHQLSTTGQNKRSILSRKIDTPRGLCFNDTFDKLAIVGGSEKCYLQLYKYI